MNDIDRLLERVAVDPGVAESESEPFPLRSNVVPRSDASREATTAASLYEEMRRLWAQCDGLRLLVDVKFGQWGLVIVDPELSEFLTQRERRAKPDDFGPGDLVIGRFLGDEQLVVLTGDGVTADCVLIALPIDPRRDWPAVAGSVVELANRWLDARGNKFWRS